MLDLEPQTFLATGDVAYSCQAASMITMWFSSLNVHSFPYLISGVSKRFISKPLSLSLSQSCCVWHLTQRKLCLYLNWRKCFRDFKVQWHCPSRRQWYCFLRHLLYILNRYIFLLKYDNLDCIVLLYSKTMSPQYGYARSDAYNDKRVPTI